MRRDDTRAAASVVSAGERAGTAAEPHDQKGTALSVFSSRTKAQIGAETAKQVAKRPKLALRGAKAAGEARTARTRVLPGIVAGVAIGASAMYFLDSATGKHRRRSVSRRLGGSGDHHHEAGQGVEAGGPAHPGPGHLPPDSEPDTHQP
jgi:hypothetical protein